MKILIDIKKLQALPAKTSHHGHHFQVPPSKDRVASEGRSAKGVKSAIGPGSSENKVEPLSLASWCWHIDKHAAKELQK